MITIYGTASSGKSNIAENTAVSMANEYKAGLIYLATMETKSDAAKARISRHRALREGKGFITIEEMYRPSKHVDLVRNKVVLLECISNLCGNIMFDACGENIPAEAEIRDLANSIMSEIRTVSGVSKEVIIVTNNLFEDGAIYDSWTEAYLKLLAKVNCLLAAESDRFMEVSEGIISDFSDSNFGEKK